MAPSFHLVLALLFFPTLILSELLHVPLIRRHPTNLNLFDEANKIRKRYGYSTATSRTHRSNRRAVAGIPILDQVNIVIVIVLYQLIT